jgi:galactokinase
VAAVVRCLLAAGSRDVNPAGIARIAQEVEAKWAGVRCGAMDPYVAALGQPGVPILLDCLHLTHETLPWPDGVDAVAVDTGIARDLSSSPYNERRAELEAGVAVLKKARPGTQTLRDWSLDDLDALEDAIPAAPRRRLRHALTEMARVKRAAEALKKGDAKTLGGILNEGHESLSRDFEASTPAIDAQAEKLRQEPGVLGVRLQGAGFGGCLVVLREKPAEPAPDVLLEELPSVGEG